MQEPWPRSSWASTCTTSSKTRSATLPVDIYEEQIGVMADVLDAEELTAAVAGIRAQAPTTPEAVP